MTVAELGLTLEVLALVMSAWFRLPQRAVLAPLHHPRMGLDPPPVAVRARYCTRRNGRSPKSVVSVCSGWLARSGDHPTSAHGGRSFAAHRSCAQCSLRYSRAAQLVEQCVPWPSSASWPLLATAQCLVRAGW